MKMLREEELTYRIRGCVFEVYRQLGYGFLESVYHKALLHELSSRGLGVQSEVPVQVDYKGVIVGEHRLDLLVEDQIIVELKAQQKLPLGAKAQLLNYLKATNLNVGLLVNFTYPKASVERIVL
ncbi:GxxExxY protein [Marinobacter xiaoshiensis]|uniref:GxxExxY protein n=1 Tax=Marinobacter xiaoshiensis TaxID=3073652 RepID=A0ABU2HEF9_9GAMM|nr:GxxExxY protein [Marinobacter sp. F60267]MDS1309453.1 GxxExxY protein [Marinobacter sp. F60267]